MKGAKISTVSTPVSYETLDNVGSRQGGSDRTYTKTPLELCVEVSCHTSRTLVEVSCDTSRTLVEVSCNTSRTLC
jgi:hypothetical protein